MQEIVSLASSIQQPTFPHSLLPSLPILKGNGPQQAQELLHLPPPHGEAPIHTWREDHEENQQAPVSCTNS